MGCNGYVVSPWCYDPMLHPTAWVTAQSVDFLRRRDTTKPFFLYVSYHRPHPPLDPPAEYLRMYDDRVLPPPPVGDWAPTLEPRGFFDSPDPIDAHSIDRARRAYYAQITFIDHQINRLIHTLHAHDVTNNTWLVFCSDHGELLYDHNLWAKALPYEGSARIPLLIRPPRTPQGPKRQTVDAPVELRDVFPTLCDIAGVETPPSVEGESLMPFCRGETPHWRDHVHGEHFLGPRSSHWVTDGKWKYVWFSQTGVEQLFALQDDPGEMHNVAGSTPRQLAVWRERLVAELGDREEGYVEDGELVPGRPNRPILREAGLQE